MILQIDGLELYYGDAQALDGISLGAEEGELIAITLIPVLAAYRLLRHYELSML